MNWFLSKVSYEKIHENGLQKKVTEQFLVDALSFTEAESRTIEEVKPFISGEFTIADIKRYPINELFFNASGDRYYRASVDFITIDEKSGNEKRIRVYMLAQASTIEEANEVVKEGMKGTMSDYDLVGMVETKIMDVFKYEPKTTD